LIITIENDLDILYNICVLRERLNAANEKGENEMSDKLKIGFYTSCILEMLLRREPGPEVKPDMSCGLSRAAIW